LQRLGFAENPELLAIFIDDAQLRGPNIIIQAGVFGDKQYSLLVDFNVESF